MMYPPAEFAILPARSGAPTVLHLPSGLHLHSTVDPVAEARDIACRAPGPALHTVLLGGGLGYLAEAILELHGPEHAITVLELDAALVQLGRGHRPDALYYTSPRIRIVCAATLRRMMEHCRTLPDTSALVIAPYLMRLAQHEHDALAAFLHILRAEQASHVAYDAILPVHEAANCQRLSALPRAVGMHVPAEKPVMVIGAGPSLDACTDLLRQRRDAVTTVAASGAVPSLTAAGIAADWIVACEGREAVLLDLQAVPAGAHVIVFPATHPAIVARTDLELFSGEALETRGGSSAIPALDFALNATPKSTPVALLGLDLGYQNGTYARDARREEEYPAASDTLPPKFLSMRSGFERLLSLPRHSHRLVFHVLAAGQSLAGTTLLPPAALPSLFETSCVTESTRDA